MRYDEIHAVYKMRSSLGRGLAWGPKVGSSSKEWKTLSFTFECPGREAQQSRMVSEEYAWSSMESLVTSDTSVNCLFCIQTLGDSYL